MLETPKKIPKIFYRMTWRTRGILSHYYGSESNQSHYHTSFGKKIWDDFLGSLAISIEEWGFKKIKMMWKNITLIRKQCSCGAILVHVQLHFRTVKTKKQESKWEYKVIIYFGDFLKLFDLILLI